MIYFVQSTDGGPVKIGTTDNLDVRRRQLEQSYGRPLAVLATMPGGRDQEREIHARFARLRLGRTEQFQPTLELMGFIGRPLLVGANTNVIEAMDAPGDRVTLLNLKGSGEEKAFLQGLSRKTGVPLSEIARRGIAAWTAQRGLKPPADWTGE